MTILGIDPGTATTGYGLIKTKKKGTSFETLGYGCIRTSPKLPDGQRLKEIGQGTNKIINTFKPDILAVEKLFFFKNSKTIITVAQAKGIILFVAAKKKIPVFEFTPLEVKMTITGYGRAQKIQIQKMVKTILNLKKLPKPDDAADALGIAICCATYINLNLGTKGLDRVSPENIIKGVKTKRSGLKNKI